MKLKFQPPPITHPKPKSILLGLIIIVFALLCYGLFHFAKLYSKSQSEISQLKSQSQQANADVQNLIKSVGKLIELPTGEIPTIATITDKEKLKDQPFFNRAENGDQLLIYPQAKKAILYRPSINKIIDVSSVNIGNTNATPSVSPTPKP